MQRKYSGNGIHSDGHSEATSEICVNLCNLWIMTVGFSAVRAVEYPFYDGNGNITDWMDADGTLVAHHEYDPYGNEITGETPTSFGFSTKPLDSTLNLYYYGYRFYRPDWGRWMNRDPIGEYSFRLMTRTTIARREVNISYQYVSNHPINFIDYLGLASKKECNCTSDEKKKEDGCQKAADKWPTALGATFCYMGLKMTCFWPERAKEYYGFEILPNSISADCLAKHENSHFNDPLLSVCPKCRDRLGGTPMGPSPVQNEDGTYPSYPVARNQSECKAYQEALKCMDEAPDAKKDKNWAGYREHILKQIGEFCSGQTE